MYIFKIFKSNYCKIIFVAAFFLGFAMVPKSIFAGSSGFLAVLFLILFAFSMACIVRNIKERIANAHKHKASTLSIIAAAIGLSAFQVCGIGAPICGASVGMGVLSVLFPSVLIYYLTIYSTWLIGGAILIQLFSLYIMKCFKVGE